MHSLTQNIPTPCGSNWSNKRCTETDPQDTYRCKRFRSRSIGEALDSTNTFPERVSVLHVTLIDVVRYFTKIITITGCYEDIYLVSFAWTLCCKALAYASDKGLIDVSSAKQSVRSIIIGAISLSVDTCADFNASFIVSSAAWGQFFNCELARNQNKEIVDYGMDSLAYEQLEVNCRQLMRIKNLIARSLNWELQQITVVEVFSDLVNRIDVSATGCDLCYMIRNSASRFLETSTPYLESLSYCYQWDGVNQVEIGIACFLLCHDTQITREKGFTILSEMKSHIPLAIFRIKTKGVRKCVRDLIDNDQALQKAVKLILSIEFAEKVILLASKFFPCKLHTQAGEVLHLIEGTLETYETEDDSSSLHDSNC